MGRYWAFVVLAGVLWGPQLCGGALNNCRGVPGFELPPDNSFYSYEYTLDPGTNDCDGVTLRCAGFVPGVGQSLEQKSWYINPGKDQYGQRYRNNALDIYKIQCPAGTILHLFPQFINVESVAGCVANDFVMVERGQATEVIMCGDDINQNSGLYNFGRGVFVEEGNATITFCTNNVATFLGFVFRASCIRPLSYRLPGCAEFQFFFDWDPEFADLRFQTLTPPELTPLPHKRSAEWKAGPQDITPWKQLALRSMSKPAEWFKEYKKRQKRFVFETLSLTTGQCATYNDNTFVIDNGDGTTQTFSDISVVFAFNMIIGTRQFVKSTSTKFFGPAEIEIIEQMVVIKDYSVDPETLLLPSPVLAEIINKIADYIWENYLRPYPLIDETTFFQAALPLKNASSRGNFVRFSDIGLVRETITNGTCRRAVVEELSPRKGSVIDPVLARYCRFFFYACNPYLQAICSQVVSLDQIPRK